MPSEINLEATINRAQLGSVDAFAELVKQYQSKLVRFLILRGAQPADAEDITQQAFVNAWQHLKSYNPKWQFSTWLYTIAGRLASKATTLETSRENIEQDAISPVDSLDTLLKDNIWSTAHEQLENHSFQVLWLYYGEGFTGQEIGKIMQRSPIWVRVNLHRSKQLLQKVLANDTSSTAKVKKPSAKALQPSKRNV